MRAWGFDSPLPHAPPPSACPDRFDARLRRIKAVGMGSRSAFAFGDPICIMPPVRVTAWTAGFVFTCSNGAGLGSA